MANIIAAVGCSTTCYKCISVLKWQGLDPFFKSQRIIVGREICRAGNREKEHTMKDMLKWLLIPALLATSVVACTQETQNKIGRSIQNWTGTDGILEIYAGDKLVRRFIDIDKISTAYGTNDNNPRPYRFGYGVLDENFNNLRDGNEKKVYFEFSDYSTSYVFFESPR